jgi:putative tryptophan/tyrosine transport system substrate-binding protein
MERREFIAGLGSAGMVLPLCAAASQHVPSVGFLRSTSAIGSTHLVRAFSGGLAEVGYTVSKNVSLALSFADDRRERIPKLVAHLVQKRVAVIVANTPAAVAAKRAASTTPVVFVSGDDPVRLGLVSSLNRPGGMVTGINFLDVALTGKRFALLCELVPDARHVGVLLDPSVPGHAFETSEAERAARLLGRQIAVETGTTEDEVARSFRYLVDQGITAILMGGGAAFNSLRDKIVALAAEHALPASYAQPAFAEAGGLMTYGASLPDMYRQAGHYAGRILMGEHPAEMPVTRPSKFDLVINLKTAKALGLTVSRELFAMANVIIE